jgi:hypothetical protein
LKVAVLPQLAAAAQVELALRELLPLVATVVLVCKVRSRAITCFTLPAVVVV